MAPREKDPLLPSKPSLPATAPFETRLPSFQGETYSSRPNRRSSLLFLLTGLLLGLLLGAALFAWKPSTDDTISEDWRRATGPYQLVERQEGAALMDYYDFLDGPDSLGSAGYNVYVSQTAAEAAGLVNVTQETVSNVYSVNDDDTEPQDFVYLQSAVGTMKTEGKRRSVRLEGKRRFDRGLFVLDVRHVPAGCGVWPAFWLTDEANWPVNGEIDVVEGINTQVAVKTALHTTDRCNMFAQVSSYSMTGTWDRTTGMYDTFTGQPDMETNIPADNCNVMAPHQWANQGCVIESPDKATLGAPLNARGGGVFVLEWDPAGGVIRSWAFGHSETPANLVEAMSSSPDDENDTAASAPDPESWGVLPYAHFAIGDESGCSADHFQNMRLIFNLAFCGSVAGNRFARDCPVLAKEFQTESKNPVDACNAYIASNPKALEEAYWKVKGVYVYERAMV